MSDLNSQKVTEHINSIDAAYSGTIEFLRQVFLKADSAIAEHIKWNAPSFYYSGSMKEFDAKEYKRDLAVINLHRGKILIVFPTGNKIDKQIGLQGKDYPDGRKIVEIKDLEDAKKKADVITAGIKNWLSQIEK
ncbi:DUF1801 domain-containing protein [Adhaeribacter rhizoryzae]|uniref:DUF1801 domain-containing protein n=1 Tax=Adhaeribacter rhizoryzae TaxID=2607907 RepID=A0A5M6DGW4_9BACT|nr:DUF1801 domain-containing protein [Adhaeribacter rhizoryzae]KAA5546794.1 DUF1801 domain-containing protein [Adhaeribacter rhizoryzae]